MCTCVLNQDGRLCLGCRIRVQHALDRRKSLKIRVYVDIQDMTGIGEEILVDAVSNVRAVFIDGNLKAGSVYPPNMDETKAA
jgi:hypothetical protein